VYTVICCLNGRPIRIALPCWQAQYFVYKSTTLHPAQSTLPTLCIYACISSTLPALSTLLSLPVLPALPACLRYMLCLLFLSCLPVLPQFFTYLHCRHYLTPACPILSTIPAIPYLLCLPCTSMQCLPCPPRLISYPPHICSRICISMCVYVVCPTLYNSCDTVRCIP
jgi:hypothetical protein